MNIIIIRKKEKYKNEGEVQMKRKIEYLLLVLLLILSACAMPPKTDRTKITFVLDWLPNTNHTGLYIAQTKGYFEKQGLDVEIIQPANSTAEQLVASGRADFGISYQEQLTYARTTKNALPIKAVAAILQHNTSGFASLKTSGIQTPKDFEGKRYGAYGTPSEYAMLAGIMADYGADISKTEVIDVASADFFTLVPKQIDYAWIFEGWAGIEAKLRGVELNYFSLRELDDTYDYYTPIIISNDAFLAENPDIAKKMLAAITDGYNDAVADPDEAATIFLANVPEANEELVRESQKFMSTKYIDDAPYFGYMEYDRFQKPADWLFEQGLLESPLDVSEAFTNEFLPNKG